ncbi:MAG: ribosome assembly RNA-binding protein YhbY [Burkholderiales bacterium]|nr:ribosome assembly RNA-binding protein YhbY [Burkholderiales bacterium]
MEKLTVKQIQHLKALAHNLDPVVMVGDNGLTDAVIKEIDRNLTAHELIKIRVFGADRDYRSILIKDICEKTNSLLVQHIGKLLILFRVSDKHKITI